MAVYAAQIDRLDQGVGRIAQGARRRGAADNTLVLFLSDNGGCQEEVQPGWFDVTTATRDGRPVHVGNSRTSAGGDAGPEEVYQSYGPGWASASNTPFRRYKHFAHEGGIATPFIARWPAAIHRRGAIRAEVGHVIDLMPTLLELAGGSYPRHSTAAPSTPAEGESLVAALLGRPHPSRTRRCSGSTRATGPYASANWKLVAEHGKPWELYDMEADRTETHDLAGEMPEKVDGAGGGSTSSGPTGWA